MFRWIYISTACSFKISYSNSNAKSTHFYAAHSAPQGAKAEETSTSRAFGEGGGLGLRQQSNSVGANAVINGFNVSSCSRVIKGAGILQTS